MKKQKLIPAITVFAFVAFCFAIAHSFGTTYAYLEGTIAGYPDTVCPQGYSHDGPNQCRHTGTFNTLDECLSKGVSAWGVAPVEGINYCEGEEGAYQAFFSLTYDVVFYDSAKPITEKKNVSCLYNTNDECVVSGRMIPTPTRDDSRYEFIGWIPETMSCDNAENIAITKENGKQIKLGNNNLTDDDKTNDRYIAPIYKPCWKFDSTKSYTATFNAPDGTPTTQDVSCSYDTNGNCVINHSALPTATKNNHTFRGWVLESNSCDGAGLINSNGVGKITLTENQTYKACWDENQATTYSATFNVNGGIWKDGHTNQTRTISYTDKLAFTDARLEVEKTGHYWCGWTRSDGKTLGQYVDSNENGQTLTAKWCENSTPGGDTQEKILIYFVKADNTVADTKTINKNETLVMPENVSTKTGYTFNGWEDLSLNDGTIYKIGEEISFEEDAILRESWTENPDDEENETKNKVTIIYDENGGTIKKDDSSLNYCEYSKDETSCAIKKLPTATREEYTFKGWGETNTCTEGYTTEIPNLTIDKNGKKYYACWTKNETSGENDNEKPNTPEKPKEDEDNPQTGSTLLYLVYLAGILSLCYTVVYSYRYIKANK